MRHASFLLGLVLLAAIVAAAVLAPLLASHDPYEQDLANRLIPPFWMDGSEPAHLLGTDQLGRDLLARLLFGARVSLAIGFAAMLMSAVIGISLGLLAGFFGGWVDTAISFLITARLALPVILVALAVVALAGSSLIVVIVVLGSLIWDRFALVTRASVQQLRGAEFVTAASLQGLSSLQIVVREILPNIFNSLIVIATLRRPARSSLKRRCPFSGWAFPAAALVGPHGGRRQGRDPVQFLADHDPGRDAVPPGAGHQSRRRRPARHRLAGVPELRWPEPR